MISISMSTLAIDALICMCSKIMVGGSPSTPPVSAPDTVTDRLLTITTTITTSKPGLLHSKCQVCESVSCFHINLIMVSYHPCLDNGEM